MDADIRAAFDNLAKLIEDTNQSLQSEMRTGFDRVEAATRRNTTSLVGGAVAIASLHKWAAQRDKLDTRRDREISELRKRVTRLERSARRRAS